MKNRYGGSAAAGGGRFTAICTVDAATFLDARRTGLLDVVHLNTKVVLANTEFLATELAERLDACTLERAAAGVVLHDNLLTHPSICAVRIAGAALGAHRALEHVLVAQDTNPRSSFFGSFTCKASEIGGRFVAREVPLRARLAGIPGRLGLVGVDAEQLVAAQRGKRNELALWGLDTAVVARGSHVSFGASRQRRNHAQRRAAEQKVAGTKAGK